MRSILVLSIFLFLVHRSNAQAQDLGFRCKANDPATIEAIVQGDPEKQARMALAQAVLDAHTASFVRDRGNQFTIPVVFHIVHAFGPENISDAQIMDAIRVLNEDFNRLNAGWETVRPEFLDRVADVGFTFRLAQRDPFGNCTNGITRTVSQLTFEGNYDMTQLIQWPRENYLNIWVGQAANGAAGYSNYPWVLDDQPERDGIVIQASYVGSIGTSDVGRSHVLTHEVGHWLNLKHCWGNSNDPGLEENCGMDDDVDDTPLTIGWTSCSLNGSSCGSELDNVENYMEYASCRKMFTEGQSNRMIAALTSSVAQREQLWGPANLANTGVDSAPTLCAARLAKDRDQVCAGGSVTFSDISYNSVTERYWSFPGGEPSESNEASPVVTYASPGSYPVSLTVTDGAASLTVNEAVGVEVLEPIGTALPIMESFEDISSLTSPGWTIGDPEGDGGFVLNTTTGATGEQCVELSNGPATYGHQDELISGTFDLSGVTAVEMSFRYAYARRDGTNDDFLRVFVSNNCGTTWSLRKQLFASSTLPTAPDHLGTFVPEPGEWGESVITTIGAAHHVSGFRFKFQFHAAGGNTLYLDDINIHALTVGVDEQQTTGTDLIVRPNPASGAAQVQIPTDRPELVQLTLLDALGQSVSAVRTIQLNTGDPVVDLPLEGLSSGIYFVRVSMAGTSRVARLVVDNGH